MTVSSGKTAFGQAISYALSKETWNGAQEWTEDTNVASSPLWRPYAYSFYIHAMEAHRFLPTQQEILVPIGLEDEDV